MKSKFAVAGLIALVTMLALPAGAQAGGFYHREHVRFWKHVDAKVHYVLSMRWLCHRHHGDKHRR